MKKLILILLPLIFFAGCYGNPPTQSIAVSINTDENTTLCRDLNNNTWLTSKVNTVITGNYFLLPPSDDSFDIDSIISTNNSVIEITAVNYEVHSFTALAKNAGTAKIRVIKNEDQYYSTLKIIVN